MPTHHRKPSLPEGVIPLSRFNLDEMAAHMSCPCCGRPHSAENQMGLAPRCHPHAGVNVYYWDGLLTIACAQCNQRVTTVMVSASLLPPKLTK